MALEAKDFIQTVSTQQDKIVRGSGPLKNQEMLVDYAVNEIFHTEPLFLVGEEQIYGYENYKQYDQYQGHGLKEIPQFMGDLQDVTEYYMIEEDGKRYASGKTYYLGFQVIAVPFYHST